MTESKQLWALLIGVDCYMENKLPGGGYYPSLSGCVRDVNHVEAYLRTRLHLTDDRLIKLTASNPGGVPDDRDPKRKPVEPPSQWPTYENIVAAFHRITEEAEPGAQVYIQYSGHGGRATTAFPQLKGDGAFDESLVPTNIGSSEARYLRDVEIGPLLDAMADKGLFAFMVCDCCHSGDSLRGKGGAVRRGIDHPDTRPLSTDSLVASREELVRAWRAKGATRDVKPASGWLSSAEGYVFLAACRAQESANEYPFDGEEYNGALTYWLLRTLEQPQPNLTYQNLLDGILARIHGQFALQTPQLQGEGDRRVFGRDRLDAIYAIPVLEHDATKGRVRINAGQIHLLREGAKLAIYPPNGDPRSAAGRLALAELQDAPGAVESWAKITKTLEDGPIEPGARAVLLDPGTVRLQRPVSLFVRDDLPSDIDQNQALEAVRALLEEDGRAFAPLARDGESSAFQVVVTENREYEVWDAAGSTIPNQGTRLSIGDEKAPRALVDRLVHMAKFRNVQDLFNNDSQSFLAGALLVELAGKAETFDRSEKPDPQPFDDPGSTPTLRPDQWVFLRIKNTLPRVEGNHEANVLNVTVLDLVSSWAITQIHPRRPGEYFVSLDPTQEILLPLKASLPDGHDHVTDTIKVLATTSTTNFRWLELPRLDQPPKRKAGVNRGPKSALDGLLDALVEVQPRTRTVSTPEFATDEWTAGQVELRVDGR